MYKNFFHLRDAPFSGSPDPAFLLMLPQTREALAGLQYGISNRKGFLVLTGEVGTGKTTLLQQILSTLDQGKVLVAFVFNPQLDVLDFLEFILIDFGLVPVSRTKSGMLLQLNRWLIDRYREGKSCVVIVDEAHHLSWELLEEIRLLTNLETASQKLLQIVLCAQPELEDMLRQPNARQLRQRIALWCRTGPLEESQIAPYVQTRLRLAALPDPFPFAVEEIFPPAVLRLIYQASAGIPRLVNLICEHCLLLGYVDDQRVITIPMVQAVLRDTELQTYARPVDLAHRSQVRSENETP